MSRSHQGLIVWQKGMDLVVGVYDLTREFPGHEAFGLTNQIRRSAVSVPANIAEGHGRGSAKDYAQFLAVARGSLMETETYVMLAVRLGYLSMDVVEPILSLISEINKMLNTLRTRLRPRYS